MEAEAEVERGRAYEPRTVGTSGSWKRRETSPSEPPQGSPAHTLILAP